MTNSPPETAPARPAPSFRHLVWAGLFMLCGLCFLIYLGNDRHKVIGQPVGDLDLVPLIHADAPFDLRKARGKWVLLHFWGPWCPPCRMEYPEIEKLAAQYQGGSDVHIISISCDASSPDNVPQLKDDTLAMLTDPSAGHPVYCDPAEYSRIQVAKIFAKKGFAYPTTILLDRQGHIADYWLGATRPGELQGAIQKSLGKSARSGG